MPWKAFWSERIHTLFVFIANYQSGGMVTTPNRKNSKEWQIPRTRRILTSFRKGKRLKRYRRVFRHPHTTVRLKNYAILCAFLITPIPLFTSNCTERWWWQRVGWLGCQLICKSLKLWMCSDLWLPCPFQYNQFINQNTRLKETASGLSSLSTNVASTPKSQSITSNSHDVASSYSSNPFHKGPNGDLSNNSIDYDFNINAIKTLLMTSKVPESCVWSVRVRGRRKVNYSDRACKQHACDCSRIDFPPIFGPPTCLI